MIYEERPCIERMQGILLKWTVQNVQTGKTKLNDKSITGFMAGWKIERTS